MKSKTYKILHKGSEIHLRAARSLIENCGLFEVHIMPTSQIPIYEQPRYFIEICELCDYIQSQQVPAGDILNN